MPIPRAKKILFTLILAGISGSILLLFTELILRWKERAFIQSFHDAGENAGVIPSDIPGLNYTLRHDYRHGDIVFNQYGFNMPTMAQAKAADTIRIMLVGDSVTQGVGIQSTAEAFPNRIHALLDNTSLTGRVEVWNAGVGGYNAGQIDLLMREVLPVFDPDLIVYTFNFNDYWEPNQYFHGQAAIPPDQVKEQGRAGWLDQLKKIRTVIFLRDHYNALTYRVRGYAPVYVDKKINYPSWLAMKDKIVDMQKWCRENSIGFAMVIHPNKQFLFVPEENNLAHRDLVEFLTQQQIDHLDMLPAMKPHRDRDLYLPDGNHMTPEGYSLIADIITPWLRDRLAAIEFKKETP